MVFSLPAAIPMGTSFLQLEEEESFSQQKWKDLIEKAMNGSLPYYMIGLYLYEGKIINVYDGIALKKHCILASQTGGLKDPLTRRIVDDVQYLFLKTFSLDDNGKEKKLTTQELTFLPLNFTLSDKKYLDLAVSGLNVHALASDNDKVKDMVAKCQYAFGSHLMLQSEKTLQKEGVRWLMCSARNHSNQSAEVLTHLYQEGKIVQKNKKLASYWSKLPQTTASAFKP